MIRIDIQGTKFFLENTRAENKEYFSFTGNKFLHEIDNFYYSVYLKNDSNQHEEFDRFYFKARQLRELLKDKKRGDLLEFEKTGLYVRLKSYKFYNLCFSDPDRFDIFISEYLPNDVTARIVVQIRSNALWLEGYTKLIIESFNRLQQILEPYDIEIERTLENRNDMAYHTNMIQKPEKEFSDSRLEKYLQTTQEIYSKVGRIRKKSKNKLSIEYFSLGNRDSNCLFERFYNKTREVIEKGYKGFFIDIWYQNRLISYYDKFCYEFAYQKKNYEALYEGRLRFYLKHGKNYETKKQIELLLGQSDTRLSDLEALANSIMPDVTLILNIEFETKRTFYRSADAQIELLPYRKKYLNKSVPEQIHRLFKILDNRKIFLDYITSKTVSFQTEKGYCAWWQRLRSLKIKSKSNDELVREYNTDLDKDAVVKRILNMVGTLATYDRRTETTFIEDMSYLLSNINDNDMHNVFMVNLDTGQVVDSISIEHTEAYERYKEKKYKAIKNRLKSDRDKSENNPT